MVKMFDFEKIVMAINYFAREKHGKSVDKLEVLKLIYLADRYHLRKFGRLITEDNYFAMPLGPVPSLAKDICNNHSSLTKEQHDFAYKYLSLNDKLDVVHSKRGEKDCFSVSEKEALKAALSISFKEKDLPDFTHHFPEWKKYESKLLTPDSCCKMNHMDFFLPMNEEEYEYCTISSRLLNSSKEKYLEAKAFEEFVKQK